LTTVKEKFTVNEKIRKGTVSPLYRHTSSEHQNSGR